VPEVGAVPIDTLLAVANLLVLPFWVLMIGAPRWRVTKRSARSPLLGLGPVIVYTALVLSEMARTCAACRGAGTVTLA
jgi:hypothetical protein